MSCFAAGLAIMSIAITADATNRAGQLKSMIYKDNLITCFRLYTDLSFMLCFSKGYRIVS